MGFQIRRRSDGGDEELEFTQGKCRTHAAAEFCLCHPAQYLSSIPSTSPPDHLPFVLALVRCDDYRPANFDEPPITWKLRCSTGAKISPAGRQNRQSLPTVMGQLKSLRKPIQLMDQDLQQLQGAVSEQAERPWAVS